MALDRPLKLEFLKARSDSSSSALEPPCAEDNVKIQVASICQPRNEGIKKKYIDVVGISGSGKTTLVNVCNDILKTTDEAECSKGTSNKGDIIKFLCHYKNFMNIVRDPIIKNNELSGWIENLILKFMNIDSNKTEIIDEGFVCRINSIFHMQNANKCKKNVEEYLESIPLPEMILFIDIDSHTAYERMLERKKGLPRRLKGLSKENIIKLLDNQREVIKIVKSKLKRNSSVKVVDINQNYSVIELKEMLLKSCLA